MKYRLTFLERTNASGTPSESPPGYVTVKTADGVVVDRTFVERTPPEALHSEETLDEDDDFMSVGEETWDYEVADGRDREFLDAVRNSQMVMECISLDDEPTPE